MEEERQRSTYTREMHTELRSFTSGGQLDNAAIREHLRVIESVRWSALMADDCRMVGAFDTLL